MPFGAQLRAREPAGRKLGAAVGHVLSAEDAQREHLFRRELRPEPGREDPAERFRPAVHVAPLHPVVDDNPDSHVRGGLRQCTRGDAIGQHARRTSRCEPEHTRTSRAPQQTARIERRRLPNQRAPAIVQRRDLEFEPAAAGQFQIGGEPQPAIGLVTFDGPAVDDVADGAAFGSRRPRRMPDAAEPAIQPAAHPRAVAEIPPGGAADRRTGANACAGGTSTTIVRVSPFAARRAPSSIAGRERRRKRHRLDSKRVARGRRSDDGRSSSGPRPARGRSGPAPA